MESSGYFHIELFNQPKTPNIQKPAEPQKTYVCEGDDNVSTERYDKKIKGK